MMSDNYDKEFVKLIMENLRKDYEGDFEKEKVPMTEEEEAEEIIRRLSTIPKNATFRDVVLPMIRRITPSLIASEIMGVQPMTGPVGEIFTTESIKMTQSEDNKQVPVTPHPAPPVRPTPPPLRQRRWK